MKGIFRARARAVRLGIMQGVFWEGLIAFGRRTITSCLLNHNPSTRQTHCMSRACLAPSLAPAQTEGVIAALALVHLLLTCARAPTWPFGARWLGNRLLHMARFALELSPPESHCRRLETIAVVPPRFTRAGPASPAAAALSCSGLHAASHVLEHLKAPVVSEFVKAPAARGGVRRATRGMGFVDEGPRAGGGLHRRRRGPVHMREKGACAAAGL